MGLSVLIWKMGTITYTRVIKTIKQGEYIMILIKYNAPISYDDRAVVSVKKALNSDNPERKFLLLYLLFPLGQVI